MAIYATGSISGTHANPAVTLALALYRKFSWRKVIPYCVAQVVGGVLGAALVYVLYVPVIDHFNQAAQLTRAAGGAAGVFFTHPGLAITPMHAFGDEIILTAFLIFGIFAITEQYNEMAPQANSSALMIGLLVALIGASMGYLEAWALNPARDLGPTHLLLSRPAGDRPRSLRLKISGGSRSLAPCSAAAWAGLPTSTWFAPFCRRTCGPSLGNRNEQDFAPAFSALAMAALASKSLAQPNRRASYCC